MQGSAAIAEGIVILNVVVNERCLVERFDGQRRASYTVRRRAALNRERAGSALEGVIRGERDERPQTLTTLPQPVVGDGLMLRQRITARFSPLPCTRGRGVRNCGCAEPSDSIPRPHI